MMEHDRYCRCGCGRMTEPTPCMPGCGHSSCGCTTGGEGFLLPRIAGAGRSWQRQCGLCLKVTGLPCDLTPPLTLCSVQAGSAEKWCFQPENGGRCLTVRLPLTCQVQDGCGKMHVGYADITVDVPMRLQVPCSEAWRCPVMIQPCVHLLCPPACAEQPCFDAQLEVLVEAYLIRWEPCMTGGYRPRCPELPLYPQPCSCHHQR